jgi:hypothetical protein
MDFFAALINNCFASSLLYLQAVYQAFNCSAILAWRITVADYDKYVIKTKAQMDALGRKLVEFTNNDKSFVMTSEYL